MDGVFESAPPVLTTKGLSPIQLMGDRLQVRLLGNIMKTNLTTVVGRPPDCTLAFCLARKVLIEYITNKS